MQAKSQKNIMRDITSHISTPMSYCIGWNQPKQPTVFQPTINFNKSPCDHKFDHLAENGTSAVLWFFAFYDRINLNFSFAGS